MNPDLAKVLAAFSCGPQTSVRSLGKGNINATYFVESSSTSFVLQKINNNVFADPAAIIENYNRLYQHFRNLPASRREGFVIPAPVPITDNSLSYVDQAGDYWRALTFVPTNTPEIVQTSRQAFSVGRTLARFHRIVNGLNLDLLTDPLPGFHILSGYLQNYDRCLTNKTFEHEESLCYCLEMVAKYRERAGTLERRQHSDISLQPVHGDPKFDNFIYDRSGDAIGMLDLDTVGAGIVYHDIGDCLRSVCNISGEGPGANKGGIFSLELFESTLKGYSSAIPAGSNKLQPELIFYGLLAICFELGVRFFTDHLQGNIYFRVESHGENLLKAKKQFLLCEEISQNSSEIYRQARQIVEQGEVAN